MNTFACLCYFRMTDSLPWKCSTNLVTKRKNSRSFDEKVRLRDKGLIRFDINKIEESAAILYG